MKKRLKINGVIMAILFLLAFAFSEVFFRKASLAAGVQIVKITGFTLILLGQLFRISARGFKAQHSLQGGALIQEGPYSLVRNPMYLGILLIGLGVVLMLFKWWVVLVFLAMFSLRYVTLTQEEERKLSALFPGTYQSYCRKVPRIIPSFSSLLKRDVKEYLPLQFSWIEKEIGSVLTLLAATLLVEAWFDSKGLGIKAYFPEAIARATVALLFMAWLFLLGSPAGEKK